MALTEIGTPLQGRTPTGKVVMGAFVWTTTDATGELPCHGLVAIRAITLTPVLGTGGGHDPQDFIEVDEALDSAGVMIVPSSGTITLERAASGSSASKVLYRLEGY